MKIGICDDDYFICEQLKDFIKRMMLENVIHGDPNIVYYENGEALLQRYEEDGRCDILFLDIAMRRADGITVGKLLREMDNQVILIFVSSHQERVMDTFDCMTFNFLPKPLKFEKFRQVFADAVRLYRRNHTLYTIQFRNNWVRVPINKIKYVELAHRHLFFHTEEGTYEMISNLRDVMEDLRPYDFLQTHQAYIVNMNCIKRFSKNEIILNDGSSIPISGHRRPEIVGSYKSFVERC